MSFKKPNLFILGAPKCGTTSLYHWLKAHPDIFMSEIKEPHYFNTDGLNSIQKKEDYEELFSDTDKNHKFIGEASTHYLYSKRAVPSILEYNPRSKFLVCIRNPVDMVQSLHKERLKQGVETLKSLEKAWEIQKERRKGKKIPFTLRNDPQRLQYGDYCKLGSQLKYIKKHIPNDDLYILFLEVLKNNPHKEYNKVLSFLGLNTINNINYEVYNKSKETRFPRINRVIRDIVYVKRSIGIPFGLGMANIIKKINSKEKERESVSLEMKNRLINYFEEEVLLLEKLTGKNLQHWLK